MKKRILLGLSLAIVLFILVISSDNDIIQRVAPVLGYPDDWSISCYEGPSTVDGIQELGHGGDVDLTGTGKSIFFLETSCFSKHGTELNSRQACAVESAAMMNPKRTVFLLFLSPTKFSNSSTVFVKQLLTYENVRIRHLRVEEYMKSTPLEKWYTSGFLKSSRWPRSHMSDILRYLTLWKYGGIYLDLDVVIMSHLEDLTNFSGAEDWEHVAAGVMGFSVDGLGRRMADACLRDLRQNFRGNDWGNNGPGVITRTLKKICATKYVSSQTDVYSVVPGSSCGYHVQIQKTKLQAQDVFRMCWTASAMTSSRCHGFTVYPPSVFYPIHYSNWKAYFETEDGNKTMALLAKAKAIHVWNKLSRTKSIPKGSRVPYAMIAQRYCPKVYSHSGAMF